MKKTILLVGFHALAALMFLVGLILATGRTVSGKIDRVENSTPDAVRFVPPLERIVREREESKKTKEEAFHTKSTPPKIKIFQTSYKEGTQVTFNHARHVEEYKLNCIECHHVERCNKCHLKGESRTLEIAKGKQAFHENCIGCHADNRGPENCVDCHKQ